MAGGNWHIGNPPAELMANPSGSAPLKRNEWVGSIIDPANQGGNAGIPLVPDYMSGAGVFLYEKTR